MITYNGFLTLGDNSTLLIQSPPANSNETTGFSPTSLIIGDNVRIVTRGNLTLGVAKDPFADPLHPTHHVNLELDNILVSVSPISHSPPAPKILEV